MLTEIASFVRFFADQAPPGTHAVTRSSDGALRAVIGTGLYLRVEALIGIARGFILRSTAGGIAALVAILLVLTGVVSILPETWQAKISRYLPSDAGAALYDRHPDPLVGAMQRVRGVLTVRRRRVAAAAIALKRRDTE